MIISQWTADDTAFVEDYDAAMAELNAERAKAAFEETRDHARFESYFGDGNLQSGDNCSLCNGAFGTCTC